MSEFNSLDIDGMPRSTYCSDFFEGALHDLVEKLRGELDHIDVSNAQSRAVVWNSRRPSFAHIFPGRNVKLVSLTFSSDDTVFNFKKEIIGDAAVTPGSWVTYF